ncbi:hypothetical protein ONZ45_g8787 [Pleurotus djamor]|nr:hypothetical protein ONZ45_g8787 [Pleurotus djamor]
MAASVIRGFGHPPINEKDTVVRVSGVSASVSAQQVVSLFSAQIGSVKCYFESGDERGRCVDVHFLFRDAAKRSLCLDGYVLDGSLLSVRMAHAQKDTTKGSDQRRNLYVLGLPFELNKTELAALFEPYGTVSHCVILATVDNASRRRGFVVMSTHEEAKFAMNSLSHTDVNGHTLDVSWAVVQRSQGFLDGGDRIVALESPLSESSLDPPLLDRGAPQPTATPAQSSLPALSISLLPTSLLLVKNLPSFLFSQVSDLKPLFYPFGPTKMIQLLSSTENERLNNLDTIRSPESSSASDSISVLVEFTTVPDAEDAKTSLHGQVYSDLVVAVNFLSQRLPVPVKSDTSVFPYQGFPGCFVDPYPFAFGQPHYFPGPMIYNSRHDRLPYYTGPLSYGLPMIPPLYTGYTASPYQTHPYSLPAPLPPWTRFDSRSSSMDSRYAEV